MSKNSIGLLADNQLIGLMKNRHEKAFSELYDRYWKRLFSYAFKILEDEQACEDIVQEVFIKLWQNAPHLTIEKVEAYLFRAIKYQVSNTIRDLKWQRDNEGTLDRLASALSADHNMEIVELQAAIEKNIEALPERCREVLILSRRDQLSNQEIADKLGLSVRTVETHIYHALQVLKKNLPRLASIACCLHIM